MRFVADAGLWTTGPAPEGVPLTTVLEVAGAVLSWTVDDPARGVHITFTDAARADWLWRVVGDSGHSAIVATLEAGTAAGELEVAADIATGSLDSLRRLALGHWLRRWWPASQRDGIAELDSALLDGEIALLTVTAEPFFADDTFDSDVAGLLRPHAEALKAIARQGDPRVADIVAACAGLAEDAGVPFGESVSVAGAARRDDYALAAGAGSSENLHAAIVAGVGSLTWSAVPPGVFDAAEDTVDWRIEAGAGGVTAVVRTEVSGPGSPGGIAVRVDSGPITGVGFLDAAGTAVVELFDEGAGPATEFRAWNYDWRDTQVTVGAPMHESLQARDRVRAFARARLRRPEGDAFLAEVIAAESDY